NSFLLFKSHDEISLVLAKLKLEGFEVYLVFKKNDRIIAQEVNQDLQFKDKDGNNTSIFSLENALREIHQPSQIDETSQTLQLSSDQSLILSYQQFCEVQNSLADNQFLDIGVLQNHSTLTISRGVNLPTDDQIDENEIEERLSVKSHLLKNANTNLANKEPALKECLEYLKYLSYHPQITVDLKSSEFDSHEIYLNIYSGILKKLNNYEFEISNYLNIKKTNPQVIDKIFNDLWGLALKNDNEEEKNIVCKNILKLFWFHHPDFELLISRAKELEEFFSLDSQQEIFNKLFKDQEILANYISSVLDLSEKDKEKRNFSILKERFLSSSASFKNLQIYNLLTENSDLYCDPDLIKSITLNDSPSADKFVTISIDFDLLDDTKNKLISENISFCEVITDGHGEKQFKASLSVNNLIKLLTKKIFSTHHDLLNKFGDDILKSLFDQDDLNKILDGINIFLKIFSQNPDHPLIKKFEKKLTGFLIANKTLNKDHSVIIRLLNIIDLNDNFRPRIPFQTILYLKESGFLSSNYHVALMLLPHFTDPQIKEYTKQFIKKLSLDDQKIFISGFNQFIRGKDELYKKIYLLDLLFELRDEGSIEIPDRFYEEVSQNFPNISSRIFNKLVDKDISPNDRNSELQCGLYADDFRASLDKNLAKRIKGEIQAKLAKYSDYKLTSPVKIKLINLNPETLTQIKKLLAEGNLDSEKILCLELINFDKSITDPTQRKQLFESAINLFANLKHLTINKKLEDLALSSMAELTAKKLTINFRDLFEDQLTSYLSNEEASHPVPNLKKNRSSLSFASSLFFKSFRSSIFSKKPPPGHITNTTDPFASIPSAPSQAGSSLYIASGNSRSQAQSSSSKGNFKMVEAGKILHRFANASGGEIYLRSSLKKLNKYCTSLDPDWLNDIDLNKTKETPRKYSDLESVTNYQIDEKLKQTHTACYFTQELSSSSLNQLISISPDNEIIGYHVDPSDAQLNFTKDEAGFYLVETNKRCTISYVMQGQELNRYCVSDTQSYSANIDENILDIFSEYIGTNPSDFPLSIKYDSYQLPPYDEDESKKNPTTYNQQWLDQLFKIQNKGSCRHRVMAMANAFESAGIDSNKFRIIAINNNHELIEVKGKDNSWHSINFGGEQADLSYDLANKYSSSVGSLDISKQVSSLGDGDPLSNIQTDQLPTISEEMPSDISLDHSQSHHSQSPTSTQLKLEELYQLKSIGNIEDLTGVLFSKNNQAFLLRSANYHDLKNYLLNFSVNSQLQYSANSSHRANNYDRKSFLVVDDPLEFISSNKRIV
ncbi:MAG: hypothetical protein RL769_752, partial [Pseudomonadota bacterium]